MDFDDFEDVKDVKERRSVDNTATSDNFDSLNFLKSIMNDFTK